MLTADTNPDFKPRMEGIINEGREIVAIVSSIINNTRKPKSAIQQPRMNVVSAPDE